MRTADRVLIAVAVLTVTGCGQVTSRGTSTSAGNSDSAELVRVETVAVQQRDLTQSVEIPGTVEGFETADLFAKVGGYLEGIFVDIGDRVTKGQELAKLYVPEMLKELEQKKAEIARAEADVNQALAAIRQEEAEVVRAEAMRDEAKTLRGEKEADLQFRVAELNRTRQLVDRGSVLAQRLDEVTFQHDAAEAALASIAARIRTSEAGLNAAKASLDKAKSDHASVVARVDVAQADYDRVNALVQYSSIRAPFDGFVTKRWVHRGAFIQPAQGNSAAKPLLTVTRTDVVRVSVDLSMSEVRWLDRGDRAVLDRINVLPGEKFTGQVTRYSSSLDATSRMMRVEIDLENSDHRLLPGYYGYVTLYLEEMPQTSVIPSSALLTDGAATYVYVVEDGVCRKRAVTTNYQDGTIVGIASGLQGNEQIVRAGGGQLSEGRKVTPVMAESKNASG
jgi:HlyD family secretion protein